MDFSSEITESDTESTQPTLEQRIQAIHNASLMLTSIVEPSYDPDRPLVEQIDEAYDSDHSLSDHLAAMVEDNPLFQRFQRTLETHLVKVKGQLETEIAELEHKLSDVDRVREELGTELYDVQHEIDRQRTEIHKYATETYEMSEKRQKHQENVNLMRRDLKQRQSNYNESKRVCNEMLRELDNLQILENEMAKWSKEVKDEVVVAKRVAAKDEKTLQLHVEEKRKMDMFLLTLDAEVRRRENELTNINEQIKEQDGIIDELKKSIVDANSDLEVLQCEQKRLQQSWGEIIVAIQHRDRVLAKSKADLQHEFEEQKCLESAIENTKKAMRNEQKEIDKLTHFQDRMLRDIGMLERDYDRDRTENEKVLQEIDNFTAILAKTEEDFQHARSEGLVIENHLKKLELQVERQSKQKFHLEERILELLQDQITSDKASDHRAKLLRQTQERRRKLEIQVSNVENQLADALLELERYKGIVETSKQNVARLQKEHDTVDDESKRINAEITAMKLDISQKLRKLDMLNKELDRLIELAGGREINPKEMRILELEGEINDLDEKLRESQTYWMRLQSDVVHLSQKRTQQLKEIIISRKQLLVIEQRALKIDNALHQLDTEKKENDRELHTLNTKFSKLNARLFDKKTHHEREEYQCEVMHTEMNIKLEDTEREILQLEDEIECLQEEIEQHRKEALEKHHEVLSWETKYKMAVEIKKYRDEELSSTSELAEIKAEIHRMEVRYSQLKRAQERLLQDLDNSIHQRGHIFDTGNYKEKIANYHKSKSRSVLQHKINEMKNKIKQMKQEIGTAESSLGEIVNQQRKLEEDIETKKQELEDERMQEKLLQEEVEQGLLLKQENLENIVRKQHRAKSYRKLSNQCQPYKRRSEAAVNQDYERQAEAHEHLVNIVEGLQQEFTDQKYVTAKILQTLKG